MAVQQEEVNGGGGEATIDGLDGWQREEILIDLDPNVDLEFLKKAEAMSGKKPPVKASREKLVKTHNSYVQQQGDQTGAPRLVKKLILALAYPASVKSIHDLETMPLSELHVECQADEKRLILRTITPPYTGSGMISVVEDEFGNVDKIGIYNQSDASMLFRLPQGSILAVKEPYYKYSGDDDYMICVDHPSDIILLEPDDDLVPAKFRDENAIKSKSAVEWRQAGDRAFIEKNLPLALSCYTKALDATKKGDEAVSAGIYAKRAGTHLVLKCFDDAISDALASRQGSGVPSDWKAYYTAGRAAYELGRFDEAHSYLSQALEQSPELPAIKRELERAAARRTEAETGRYDFAAMEKLVSSKNIHMDRASFLSRTLVQDSPHHGRGLFAARDIGAGELIFVEKALCLPDQFNPQHNSAALFGVLLEQCCKNPSVHKRVLDMYAGAYKRSGAEGSVVDGKPVIDVFLVESIRRKNCFSGPQTSLGAARSDWAIKSGLSRGLWQHAALANHACVPNSNRSFVGDLMISVATTNIPAGDEITHVYLPPRAVFAARTEQFRQWGFDCGCDLCAGERKSPRESHEKRREVLAEIQATIQKKNPARHHPDATIRVVERLARRLEELHEKEIYGTLPMLMLVWPSMWLLQAWRTRKNHTKVVKWSLAALRAFGFLEPVRDGQLNVFRDGTKASITFEGLKALRCAQNAYTALGQGELAKQCGEACSLAFKTLVGFDAEFSDSVLEF